MSDSKERVRQIAREMGLSIPDERIEQLAEAWEQALAEADAVRQQPTPWPTPIQFDAAWSKKR